jgi:hypothetical protein
MAHAGKHIDHLAQVCNDYLARDPLQVDPEPTDQPGKAAYRLHITAPIPVEIALIIGDVLHNLRSALDSVVFEMVRVDLSRELSPEEERSCQFPICDDPPSFKKFFSNDTWRKKIMPSHLREALRSVQPFYGLEYLKGIGAAEGRGSYADHSPYYALSTLARMSNIDKHRRLAVTAWWPDIVSWGSNGQTNRRWLPGDGSIVGYIVGSDETGDDVHHEFSLILADPFPPVMRGPGNEVVGTAKSWQTTVVWTLQQVISSYEQARGEGASMVDRERIIAAHDAWRDARKAYHDEAAKYVEAWWGDGPPPEDVRLEPVTPETWPKLTRLREAEGAALAAYRDVLNET